MADGSFELAPVLPYRLDLTVWTLRRRSHNRVDRWDGTTYRRVLSLPTGPVEAAVTQTGPPEAARLQVVVAQRPIRAAVQAAVTQALERLLGLHVDLTEFYRFAARQRRLGPLARRFRGMKPPRFESVFEAAINAIACQQVTLSLGIRLLSDLAATFGAALHGGGHGGEGDGEVHAFPRPADLARLSPPDLRPLGFSRQKGRAMIELARSIAEERLDLEQLATLTDEEALERLREIRGVGRWTAEYVLLRGMGRTHVFPGDDVGARNNLRRWLDLAEPLGYEEVRATLSGWDDYSGLLYFHLLLDRLAESGDLGGQFVGMRDPSVAGSAAHPARSDLRRGD